MHTWGITKEGYLSWMICPGGFLTLVLQDCYEVRALCEYTVTRQGSVYHLQNRPPGFQNTRKTAPPGFHHG